LVILLEWNVLIEIGWRANPATMVCFPPRVFGQLMESLIEAGMKEEVSGKLMVDLD
jgi:hypothetical protein